MLISGSFTVSVAKACSRCGKSFMDHHRVGGRLLSIADVERNAKTAVPNIPVGWSMSGRDDIRCPECTRAK